MTPKYVCTEEMDRLARQRRHIQESYDKKEGRRLLVPRLDDRQMQTAAAIAVCSGLDLSDEWATYDHCRLYGIEDLQTFRALVSSAQASGLCCALGGGTLGITECGTPCVLEQKS